MKRKLFSAVLILTLVLSMSAVVFAGNVEGEELKKVNKVEIIKPEVGDLNTIFMEDSLSIALKILDRDARYMNLVKIEPIFLGLEEKSTLDEETAEEIVSNPLNSIALQVKKAEKETDVQKTTLKESMEAIKIESMEDTLENAETEGIKVIEQIVLSEEELYKNYTDAKKAFDDKKAVIDQLLEKAKELNVTLDGTEPTNIRETNVEKIDLNVKYKKELVEFEALEKTYEAALKDYKKFFEIYIVEEEAIVLEGVLSIYTYNVKNVDVGDYRLEVVNEETGVIDAELEFSIILAEIVEKEVTENGLQKIKTFDTE